MNDASSHSNGGVPEQRPGHSKRLALVAAIVALTVGLSGFFMGLRHTADVSVRQRAEWKAPLSTQTPTPPASTQTGPTQPAGKAPTSDSTSRESTSESFASPASAQLNEGARVQSDASAPEALPYARMADHALRPNRDWKSRLPDLARPAATLRAVLPTPEQEEWLRRQRASRRQYDGAPPVAPHPVNQLTPAACLECHGRPTNISGIAVPQMSHAYYQNCLQCHAPAGGPTSTWRGRELSPAEGNLFQGKPAPGHGRRAYIGAPPVVPHTTWMRQNCIACHGPGGTAAFRTSHPERQNCLQCHATDSNSEQRPPLFAGSALGEERGFGNDDNTRPPPLPINTGSGRRP